MPNHRRHVLRLSMASLALSATGCTLIGLGIGALKDRKQPPIRALRGAEILRLDKGQKVKLVFRDGSEREGKLEGLSPVSAEYVDRYRAGREAPGGPALPSIGQRLDVVKREGRSQSVVFRGFDPGLVLARDEKRPDLSFPFADLREIRWDGGSLDQAALTARMFEGRLPFQTRLVLEKTHIPIESVESVHVGRKSYAARGALIGALVDTIILVAAFSDFSSYEPDTTYTYSCPVVGAWDGREFHEEAQMYGGAILESLARVDRAPLDHLAAVDGRLRLRLGNERGEIEYLDQVGLLAAEVPEGRMVVTTPEGGLALLQSPEPPLRAWDRRGRSESDALARADEVEWTSDPLGIDLDREGVRDSLVMEFARPTGARELRFSVRLRTTPWGAGLLGDLLRLQGREVHSLYARLERDSRERARFVAALAREGLPHVEVDEGEGLRPVGVLRNLGPLARDQAVRIPLGPSDRDRLRVRVHATAGMWRVDRASADFGPEPGLRWRPLAMRSARAHGGEDVLDRLAVKDGKVHVMPPWVSSVEVEFEAGPGGDDPATAYAVEAAGHYRILVPADGEPQRDLFDRLVDEPGAFGRHALLALRQDALRQVAAAPWRHLAEGRADFAGR